MKKIFLSASVREEDKEIIRWIKNLLEEYQLLTIFAIEDIQLRPPNEKIRELIRNSDGFIGILTKRDKIENQNMWKGPDWVQNEIGIAYECEKPIFVIIENEVDDQGLTNRITDYVKFDRNNLESAEGNIRKGIKNLRSLVVDPIDDVDVVIREMGNPLSDLGLLSRSIGKWYVLRKYGDLNVSLKNEFIILILFSIIPGYVLYDYVYGNKMLGTWGGAISIIAIVMIYTFLVISADTKCKECGNYYSIVEKPLKTSDVNYVRDYITNYDVSRVECEVCGYYEYGYRTRVREDN